MALDELHRSENRARFGAGPHVSSGSPRPVV
jgi:hypothetical protein